MIILGIDPGTARCGWGVIKKEEGKNLLLAFGCIETSKNLPHSDRVLEVYNQIIKLIKQFKPDRVGVEELFFAKNVKTAITVAEVRGAILLALKQKKVEIIEFTPYQIKQAVTGYGNADKNQIQKMVKILLKLDTIPEPDDAADGLAIAIASAQVNVAQLTD